ncbi:MAG TPA: histidine phosphatase family protein [Thermomicrobiaceae bacterium]|nr:histidine phosphatase family protein [Thermomicrobiaceae bacterium]
MRHGQTASNVDFLLHGRTDVPLTTLGAAQAAAVADRLADIGGFATLYSSPLQRAAHTARAIGQRLDLSPVLVDALSELDFGEFEGLTLRAIELQFPELFARILDANDHDFRFPHGETRREFNQRVRRAFDEIAARHPSDRLIVVAHGGVIASTIAQLTGGEINDWSRWLVHNCSITQVSWNGVGEFTLHCWNEVDHLEAVMMLDRD